MSSFSNIPYTQSIFSLGMYNADDNSLLIAYRGNNSMNLWNFNGTCSKAYKYGASIEYINNLQADCNNYDVMSRAWYTLALENMNKAIWTEPYLFSEGYFGMSLVAALEFYDTLVIFLCEIRVDTLSATVLSKDIAIPVGTIIMIATPKLDIIASSTHDIYLQDGEQTDEEIVVSTAKYIKQLGIHGEFEESFTDFDQEKGFSVSIFSFEMIYLNLIPTMDMDMDSNGTVDDLHLIRPLTLNNSDDYQYGYIVIANDDKYLFNIDLAFIISWVATGFVLIGAFTLICINMKYHDDSVARSELTANQTRQQWLSTIRTKPKFSGLKQPALCNLNPQEIELTEKVSNSTHNTVTKKLKQKKLQIGDTVNTKDGTAGVVIHISRLLEDSSFSLLGLELDNGDTVFTNLDNIILPRLYPANPFMNVLNDDLNQMEKDDVKENVGQTKVDPVSRVDSENKQCCHLNQQQLIIASFCHILCLCVFLIGIWIGLLSGARSDLIQNIMAKQEWGAAKDEVMELYKKAEMVFTIYFNRYERGDFGINSERNTLFLANLMQSFVGSHHHPLYFMHSTYLATANGELFGVGWYKNATSHKLSARLRNIDTDFDFQEYVLSDNASILQDEQILDLHLYDPRCEIWYKNAMKYTFNGTLNQAFPINNSFEEFIRDKLPAASTEACQESRVLLAEMFDIELSPHTTDIITSSNSYINNSYSYDATNDTLDGMSYKLVWTRHLFSSLNEIGLTASATIQDPITGNLFGVLGIDFSLAQLSSLLYETVKQSSSTTANNHWFAWIFDANIYKPEMIASSEFNIYADYDDAAFAQCSDVDINSKIALYATSHPNDEIRIASNEINVTGIYSLDKNANESTSIGIPINFPLLEAGRVSYFPQGEASIDWIVAKTVSDITDSTVDSIQVTLYVAFTILAMTVLLMKEINFRDEYDDGKAHSNNELDDLDKDDPNYYYKLMLKMKAIVTGAAISAWKELVENNEINIITTKQAKQFMANRANEHIACENENELKFIECAWEASLLSKFRRSRNKKFRIGAFRFIESNLYGIINQLFLCLHLVTSLFEPSTPLELKNNGLSNTVLSIIGFCILMEWFDVFLIMYRRYIEFSIAQPFLTQLYEINYGAKHKYTKLIKKAELNARYKDNKFHRRLYLVFFGPKSQIFLVHCALNILILFNFITRVFYRIGYLSYYLPVLPFLLIIRNETILKFSKDFIFAVIYAKDVLLSYISFILIFAILSQSLFKTVVNASEFSESFETITQALITAFVYISTSENYTFMYDVFDANYYVNHGSGLLINATFLSLSFAMIGLFIFVPLIIHRFELAFEERTILQDQKNILSKENAIVAAFILLDMNGDLDIDQQEFQSLVNSSILVDKNKLFDAFDDNKSGGININEFVQHLLKQTFRTKIMSKIMPQQNKLRAYLECNVIRHPLYKTWILCCLVIPFIMISLLKGIETNFSETYLNYGLYSLFGLNMFEIHFLIFIYGIQRYWDLQKYPNPNYISAAIHKYQINDENKSISEIVRLTSSERTWVKNNLFSIRPLSILEKSTLTLIHRLQLVVIWLTFFAFMFCKIYFFIYYSKIDSSNFRQMNDRYALYFIQFGVLFRLFFLIPSNQKLTYVIVSVFPQFLSLFAFLALFMYGYARIGCTIFGDNITAVVTPGVYDQASTIKTNFNNLAYAMLALLQLMIGEGWHEIMYYNVIATHPMAAIYFIAYITAVTIIISNVFVGLFLADIDQLSTEQTNDDILVNSNKTQSFEKYANYRLNLLQYKIKMDDIKKEKMQKQVDQIQLLLYQHKLKLVQNQK